MDATSRKIHPLVATAAVAVIIFSAVGIGAITGVSPTSKSNSERVDQRHEQPPMSQAPPAVQQPLPNPPRTAAAPEPAPRTQAPAPVQAPPKPVAQRPVAQPKPVHEPAPEPVVIQDQPRVAAAERSAPQPRAICYDCGTIESIREIKQAGEGSGVGAVAGGVAGAVLGRQVGGGRGRDLATVAGAVGGAVAGHQVEKHVKSSVVYEITVRMDDGSIRALSQAQPPTWRAGDKVRVQGDRLTTQG
jgi:outer membrane lipoprotein SlyB